MPVYTQEISAQETPLEEGVGPEGSSSVENRLRDAERGYTFSEGSVVNTPQSGPSIWAAVRMVLILALAAVAVYGVVFFIKRSSKQAAENDPFLKILAGVHLGSNRYVHVVAVGSKAWLLGSSDGGVNLVGEIDDKDIINAMLLESSRKSAETAAGRFPDFISIMRKFGVSAEPRTSAADDIRKRRERIKRL
ncbi:MAG: flagellar biosynthetic protein FliO [Treponema sp.]|jgi:flagellar protein FliO/FliZ|nr:flagellar biosynthetic protein FliO [Treponema sp.]